MEKIDMKHYENRFTRKPNSDILGIYYGYDNYSRQSILVKLKKRPQIDIISNVLETHVSLREDKQWALIISLTDNNLAGVFEKLTDDLVDVVSKENNQVIAERKLVKRYNEWQNLFEKEASNRLQFSEIQGLIGELFFLRYFLMKKYGNETALNAWIGPMGGNKDFQFTPEWYEVKTKSINKESVHISNSNQLKSMDTGYLIVISCEKTSSTLSSSTNLMNLYQEIIELLNADSYVREFNRKLAYSGFIPDVYYEQFNFLIHEVRVYEVNEKFPNIELNNYRDAILNLKYDLYLPELVHFEVKEI